LIVLHRQNPARFARSERLRASRALRGILEQGNGQLDRDSARACYAALTVQAGKPMTVKEIGACRSNAAGFFRAPVSVSAPNNIVSWKVAGTSRPNH